MEPGFPKKIAEDFPGVEPKVDAVFEAFGKNRLCWGGGTWYFEGTREKRRVGNLVKLLLLVHFWCQKLNPRIQMCTTCGLSYFPHLK